MKVLVACEESQTVCKAFREKGHEAYSCDIQACSGGHREWHIMGDAIPLLNGNCEFKTMDGNGHSIPDRWDLIIAHPPCTYLSNVATRHYPLRRSPAEKVVDRWEKRAKASIFFMYFALADCPRIAIENPVGFMNNAYRKPDQCIDPYMFAESEKDTEDYVTKKTCLWLKGLPKLERTNNLPKPDNSKLFGTFPSGKAKTWEDSASFKSNRSKERSRTFKGIARAMCNQWSIEEARNDQRD